MLVVSDQQMLRAGNQLLFRALEGYLKAGFKVVFLSPATDDPNLADEKDLFGDLAGRLTVVRAATPRLLGGIPGYIKSIIARPAAQKRDDTVVEGFPPPPEEIIPFKAALEGGRLLRKLNYAGMSKNFLNKALNLAKTHKFDIVCGYEVMAIPAARKAADLLNLPFFTRYQGTFLKKALEKGRAQELYPLHLAGTRIPADLCVMENDGTGGKEVLQALGHDPDRILFMVDGVGKNISRPQINRQEVYEPYGVRFNERSKFILMLSKLSPWKRHDRLIGAMPAILKRYPDAWLIIAHRGPMRAALEAYSKHIGVDHRVIFTGPVPHREVYNFLNACDFYVNCNDWSNLSNTVLEALVCGKPVLSIDDGSLDGVISDGENGSLAPLETLGQELPAKALQLLTDDDYYFRLCQGARDFAQNKLYSWDHRMAIEVERIFEIMGKPSGS